MPNYCFNTLRIYSDNAEFTKKFYKENLQLEDEEQQDSFSYLSFNKKVTIPNDQKDNWYTWNNQNWGTKWDACDVEVEDNGNEIVYIFQTAWSPPIPWLDKVSEIYTNLTFELDYSESGCDFGGKVSYENGHNTENISYNLSEYNWDKVDKNKLEEVINYYLEQNKDNDFELDEAAEIIYEEYSNYDEYLDNIQSFIEEELQRVINSNSNNLITFNHNDKGNTVNNLNL